MADELDVQVEQIAQPAVSPEVAQMMEISLNNGIAPTPAAEQQQAEIRPTAEQEQVFDADEYLKTNLGFDSWEVAKAEVQSLRDKAQTPAQFKFENEQSEKLAKAFAAGKIDEVYEYIDQQRRLDRFLTAEVTEDIAGDIIKLGLKTTHKDLTDQEIEYKYNKQYGLPKEPVLDVDDEDSVEKHNAWKEQVADIKMNKIIDAKLARPQLETAKAKLVLPDIAENVDEGYIQYKKSLEEQATTAATIDEIFKPYTPESIETKMPFNDEANKIAFEFQYRPDTEDFKKAIEMAKSPDKFLEHFRKSDGTFDNTGFLSAIDFAVNRNKYLMEAMKQSKNAAIKASLPDNSTGGMQRHTPQSQQEVSELDMQMKRSLEPYLRR